MTQKIKKIVVMAFAMIMMLAGMPASVQAQTETGLVGEWHFDGDAKDSSGNGNDGTIYGATFVDGKVGKALSFSGGEYVKILHSNSLDITDKISIEAWIKPFDKQPNDYPTVLTKHIGITPGAQYQLGLGKMESGYKIRFCAEPNLDVCQMGNKVIEVNKWNHIVVTFDGNKVGYYLNGIIDKEFIMYGPLHSYLADIGIGASSYNTWSFGGLIDEVRIYNRALTASEINELYEGEQTALSITKSASPTSIKQGQTATITLTVKNTGTTEIKDIEIKDTLPADVNYVSGEISKIYSSLAPKDSREFQYIVQINQAGTFNLNPAAATFADTKGNYQSAKSNTAAINVIASIAGTSDPTSAGTPAAATTSLTVKKEASPYSIRQYQMTNITIQIKNTGTSEIRDIEVGDSANSNLELIGGDFPNPKKYNSLSPGESRDIRYILKSKESGTFILNPATVSYSDNTGNIKVVKSEQISLTVVPSSEGSPEISYPSDIGSSSAVLLHGQKTDVVLGEDILLKLSAVNLITKPPMSVQVMIYPPSGMSVTGSEFVESGAGIYTTKYTLNPGDGKDIEVHIKTNQVGDFNAKGRIVYYFGDEKAKAEDYTLNLPIKVRKEIGSDTTQTQTPVQKSLPGFGLFTGISGLFLLAKILKGKR
ncbi:MAG: LamG-like jellyroll fold domain-containing protein [Candidatus Methanoperedens sp.]